MSHRLRVMDVRPVILEGNLVRLDPMTIEHVPALCAVGLEPFLWKLIPTKVTDEDSMSTYVRSALRDQEKGIALPFVTVERESGTVVGSTRFGNIDVNNRRAEIGWTWIAPKWQRTAINTEAKLLMLTHVFETWGCIRVELKTDALNERSRNAILRIGAKEEGIFRKHVICDDGRFRDTVYFSIINTEWPTVKAELLKKLGRN
ncbi:MAG TPA: GNAT family protein [Pyrinomonadaceae bacterium]|nr:GNAT family protein [Pyrinomonadaceae bacterium]